MFCFDVLLLNSCMYVTIMPFVFFCYYIAIQCQPLIHHLHLKRNRHLSSLAVNIQTHFYSHVFVYTYVLHIGSFWKEFACCDLMFPHFNKQPIWAKITFLRSNRETLRFTINSYVLSCIASRWKIKQHWKLSVVRWRDFNDHILTWQYVGKMGSFHY